MMQIVKLVGYFDIILPYATSCMQQNPERMVKRQDEKYHDSIMQILDALEKLKNLDVEAYEKVLQSSRLQLVEKEYNKMNPEFTTFENAFK